ncbi:hypothetical protein OO012_01765 [Rhodobacteraceae bacterium KMM 6894]|nr:hypothetical protein [Rhodobacteraceae bacterium KMM 6894]
MTDYEYKVIPAPTKGSKAPGVKTAEGRFAKTIEALLNEQANAGWQYLRSDVLPSDERQGLTSTHTVYRTLLVFRRLVEPDNIPVDNAPADEMIATAKTLAQPLEPKDSAPETDSASESGTDTIAEPPAQRESGPPRLGPARRKD